VFVPAEAPCTGRKEASSRSAPFGIVALPLRAVGGPVQQHVVQQQAQLVQLLLLRLGVHLA
jgi:hypothetical protein